MNKSEEWLKGIGATINWWDADFNKRVNQISSNGSLISNATSQIQGSAIGKEDLGFDNANTFSYVPATGIITFANGAGAAIPDVRTVFNVGDIIILPSHTIVAGELVGGVQGRVLDLIAGTANTIEIEHNLVTTAIVNNVFAFSCIRKVRNVNGTNIARDVMGFELCWQPQGLGIFKSQYAMPVGKYEFRLTPRGSNTYERASVQTEGRLPADDNTGYKMQVKDLDLYVSSMRAGMMKDGQYLLDLDETVCNSRDVTTANGDFTQEVSSATYALSLAVQDSRATGNNPVYPMTMFNPPTSRTLNRIQIQYADESKPDPISDLVFKDGTTKNDYYVQRYMDTNLYNGMMWNGSPESYYDWLNGRGPYFYIPYPKDGSDTSTTVTVYYGFQADPTNTKMLIFHHKKRVVRVKIEASTVTEVQVFDR
jgi:hypothetical protein